jgi:predicted GNAT family acetyltransferase
VLEHQKDFSFNYLATFKGEAVGTASYFLKDKSGYLMGGNILKSFRGHGFYKALVFHRLFDMKNRGRSWAISAARENTSAPILEKLGFKTAFRSSVFQWKGTLPE